MCCLPLALLKELNLIDRALLFTQGQVIDFRGLIQDAIKGASNDVNGLNSNPDPSVGYNKNYFIRYII